ncbi:MAG: GNAT family N-acetyltransferase [Vulcanimicrobiaceae bacterium]
MAADVCVVRASEDELAYFAARRWPDESGRRLYLYIAQQSKHGAWIVRDEGTPIGIAFARSNGEQQYLSELYVEPSFRNAGLGAALCAAALGDSDEAVCALLDPLDFAAISLAVRRRLALQLPVLRVAGRIPNEEALSALAFGAYRFRAVPVDPLRHRYAIAALDREVRGCERAADHELFASIATGHAIFLDDECVGYAYVWPDGRVGPLAVSSGAYAPHIFAFALMSLVSHHGASWCTAGVPGTNLRILNAARSIGLRIDMVRFFAGQAPGTELARYVGYHPLLF